ncbi:MAG: BMC domain-containing protein, partial [Alphaproteobacteria bacterium]
IQSLGAHAEDATRPSILASKIVTRIDNQHAFLINRNKLGSMILGGESLYLLECQPASYALIACNEAEKQANVKVVDVRMIGANGRLYLSGTEAEIRNAREAAEGALRKLGA